MFEAVLTVLMVVGVLYIEILWLKVVIVVAYFLLVITGIYSMIWGAPFVLTHKKKLPTILELGEFKKDDYVVDLGAGDGRVVRAVSEVGVKKVVGFEYSVLNYLVARLVHYFKKGKGKIVFGDFWKQDYKDVDVVICFLLDKTILDVEDLIWPKLKRGTRLLSNAFKMKGVHPVESKNGIHLYIKDQKIVDSK